MSLVGGSRGKHGLIVVNLNGELPPFTENHRNCSSSAGTDGNPISYFEVTRYQCPEFASLII